MRLSLIAEGPNRTLRPLYGDKRLQQYKDALSFMPARKAKHSLRVGATAAKAGLGPDEVEAAILHDYIERGGDLAKLQELNVSPRAIKIIKMLSIDEKMSDVDDTKEVQQHIEQMLADPAIDPHDKAVAIIVKCADRIDNLQKRLREKRLTPEYAAASKMLFQTLLSNYRGHPDLITHIKKKIGKLGI